jgi:hypothetical protein
MKTTLSMLAWLGLAAPLVFSMVGVSHAAEVVKFENATVPLSEFQQKRAKARGEVLQPPRGDEIPAYVVKPSGDGSYPVIIYLPGSRLRPRICSLESKRDSGANRVRRGFLR